LINIVDYQPAHLKLINVKDLHRGELPREIVHRAVTFIRQSDGEVLAIFGGFHFGPKTFHIWAFISKEAHKIPIAFAKSTIKMLAFFEQAYRLNRIQIDIRQSYKEGDKWAKTLGFKREGLMKQFAPDGEDCWLYAKCAKEVA
jgi:hypothetical protein